MAHEHHMHEVKADAEGFLGLYLMMLVHDGRIDSATPNKDQITEEFKKDLESLFASFEQHQAMMKLEKDTREEAIIVYPKTNESN